MSGETKSWRIFPGLKLINCLSGSVSESFPGEAASGQGLIGVCSFQVLVEGKRRNGWRAEIKEEVSDASEWLQRSWSSKHIWSHLWVFLRKHSMVDYIWTPWLLRLKTFHLPRKYPLERWLTSPVIPQDIQKWLKVPSMFEKSCQRPQWKISFNIISSENLGTFYIPGKQSKYCVLRINDFVAIIPTNRFIYSNSSQL